MKQEEIWKDIKGYEGLYKISSKGRVKSLKRNTTKGGIMKNIKKTYYVICLSKKGVAKYHQIHRLIAKAFIPNPNKKPQVNHIDGNKFNNEISNLEWVTVSENIKHAYKNKLHIPRKGDNAYNSKLKDKDIVDIFNLRKQGLLHREIAEIYNVSRQHIGDLLNLNQRSKRIIKKD